MSERWPQMRVSPGARADARLPAALDPIALRVRPATLAEDFAAAGRRLGAEGAALWPKAEVPPLARLFLDEPAYLLAEILAFRPEDAEQAFDIALDKAPDTAPALIRALALRLGDWVARIKARLPGLSDARPARVMQAVLTGAPGADRAAATPADPPAPCHRPAAQHARTPAQRRGQPATRRRPHLRGAARLGRIDPALGLLLAELTAARDIDAAMNTFAAWHMRFYYGQIIGQHPRPASRESVLLHLPPSARPTHIAQGTPLRARTADGTVQRFVTETPVSVSPARVASTAVLVYDTDPKISFNAALAGITNIRAARYPSGPRPAPPIPIRPTPRWCWPCVPTPNCWSPSGWTATRPGLMPSRARWTRWRHAAAPARRWPCSTRCWPATCWTSTRCGFSWAGSSRWPWSSVSRCPKAPIGTCCNPRSTPAADGSSASMIFETFARTPDGRLVYTLDDIFQKLLGDAFTLRLTTPAGPRAATWTQVLPHAEPGAGGLCFRMKLDAARPPVTAPEGAEAPVLSIRAADSARICPVSIFERYRVTAIGFYVRAEGLTDVFAFSDAGPVATDQTFLPFGPRPVDGASFTIGAPELARKPVTEIGLGLTWAALPGAGAGFGAQYRHYPDIDALPNPKLRVDYLGGEGWTALTEAPQPLFAADPVTGAPLADWRIEAPVPGQPVPAAAPVTPREFRSRQTMRAGAVRLTLSGTADGFHAGRYPLALVRAMRTQRLPFVQRPVPPEPFVPRAAGLTLSYAAADRIELNAPDTADPGERVVQVSPFGRVELFPRRTRPDVTLFPPRLGYGHLFIELDGPRATGPLALLFDIAASGHLRLVPDPNPIAWFYLTAAGWAALPATAVLSDSTAGLMRSGLVMIALPEDAARNAPDMTGKGVWMAAVATRPGLDAFPALSMVATNGLRVIRAEDGTRPAPDAPARDWSFETPRPGLGAMREIALPAAIRPPETDRHYIARVSERLRHRKRAVTPWDMERMVPVEFPEVWMAKCLPHLTRHRPGPTPGEVTLVAVRRAPETGTGTWAPRAHLFDVNTLRRIRDFLAAHAPGFARIEAVNPAFERLQVRATLAFDAFRDDGAMARRVNAEIARYLSVWTAPPAMARFGWSLNARALCAHIEALDFVRGVTDFSVLHLSGDDDGTYALLDTAQSDGRGPHVPAIRPARPWSLPLSVRDHALATAPEIRPEDPVQSGIGRLSIGDMFIVRQRTNP